jgi:hypothetical protein
MDVGERMTKAVKFNNSIKDRSQKRPLRFGSNETSSETFAELLRLEDVKVATASSVTIPKLVSRRCAWASRRQKER